MSLFLHAPLLQPQTQDSTSPAACPHDPWGNFMGWWFCDVLHSFGVDTSSKSLQKDGLADYLNSVNVAPTGNACLGLDVGSCITHDLWHVTETAVIPLVVVAMAARFLRLLGRDGLSEAPAWALAEPVLRAIVAIAAISLSFPVMVAVHELSMQVGAAAYVAITSHGGSNPVAGLRSGSGLFVGSIVILIIQWLYTSILRLMLMASLLGYQVCIVAAPLVIPLWVYGSDVGLFTWFLRAAGGAVVLPIGMGVAWGTVVTLSHRSGSGWVGFAMMTAGIWITGKFVSATSGELFRNHSLSGAMASLFFTESAILNSTRIAGAVLPTWTRSGRWLPRFTGSWTPWGLMQGSQRRFMAERSMVSNVVQRLETNSPLRRVMAGWIGEDRLREHAMIQSKSVRAHMRAGNWLGASQLVADFDQANWERGVLGAFNRLPIDEQVKLAYRAVGHGRTGLGRRDVRGEDVGRMVLKRAFGPGTPVGDDVRYWRELLQHMNTAKLVPWMVTPTDGDHMMYGPSHRRVGTAPPLPSPPHGRPY